LTFGRLTVQTAIVFYHATALPKSQVSVVPLNPRLAKLRIEPIEPIDDVNGQKGLALRLGVFYRYLVL